MGKGDKKTAKGKRVRGSYGITRKRKKVASDSKVVSVVSEKKVAEKKEAEVKPKKAPAAKKTAEKKPVEKKTTTKTTAAAPKKTVKKAAEE